METPKLKSVSRDEIARARKQVLDLIQTTYGHTPQWGNVRSRLLKIVGRDGLEGLVIGCSSECVFTEHGIGCDESDSE